MEHSLIQSSGIFATSVAAGYSVPWCRNRNSAKKGCARQKIHRDSGRALATIFGGDDGAIRGGDQLE
jgi:hypothetical protein